MQHLSKRSTTAEHTENEGDMIAACDLADELRDAIIEYQVRTNFQRRALYSPIQLLVLAAGGNLWAELSTDCKSQDLRFDRVIGF